MRHIPYSQKVETILYLENEIKTLKSDIEAKDKIISKLEREVSKKDKMIWNDERRAFVVAAMKTGNARTTAAFCTKIFGAKVAPKDVASLLKGTEPEIQKTKISFQRLEDGWWSNNIAAQDKAAKLFLRGESLQDITKAIQDEYPTVPIKFSSVYYFIRSSAPPASVDAEVSYGGKTDWTEIWEIGHFLDPKDWLKTMKKELGMHLRTGMVTDPNLLIKDWVHYNDLRRQYLENKNQLDNMK